MIGKIYEVFTHHEYDYHYVYLDNLVRLAINCVDYKESRYFQIYEEKENSQKTLRDEFAMAAMTGDWAAQDADYLGYFSKEHTAQELLQSCAKLYYRMADAMLKVSEENANTNE